MEILVVKPEEINDYIKAETIGISAPRDFVSKVQEYLQSIGRRVLLVTGLRSTGKTIGILQGIKETDTAYICPAYKGCCNVQDMKLLLSEITASNIVIDEYSWITDKDGELANYIAGLNKLGKKIILTGTESAVIHGLQSSELIHRAIEIHTNYCSYDEYRRLFNLEKTPDSLLKYLQTGGIFESRIEENFGSMKNYIQNAIIDNIASFYP